MGRLFRCMRVFCLSYKVLSCNLMSLNLVHRLCLLERTEELYEFCRIISQKLGVTFSLFFKSEVMLILAGVHTSSSYALKSLKAQLLYLRFLPNKLEIGRLPLLSKPSVISGPLPKFTPQTLILGCWRMLGVLLFLKFDGTLKMDEFLPRRSDFDV